MRAAPARRPPGETAPHCARTRQAARAHGRAVDGAPMAAARPRCNAPGGWYTNAAAAAGDCAAPFDQPFHLLVRASRRAHPAMLALGACPHGQSHMSGRPTCTRTLAEGSRACLPPLPASFQHTPTLVGPLAQNFGQGSARSDQSPACGARR